MDNDTNEFNDNTTMKSELSDNNTDSKTNNAIIYMSIKKHLS